VREAATPGYCLSRLRYGTTLSLLYHSRIRPAAPRPSRTHRRSRLCAPLLPPWHGVTEPLFSIPSVALLGAGCTQLTGGLRPASCDAPEGGRPDPSPPPPAPPPSADPAPAPDRRGHPSRADRGGRGGGAGSG